MLWRIDPSYRVAGLPRLDTTEARGLLFAVVPAIADQLGFDAAVADRTLLPAMEPSSETAARVVRDRLLVEPTHWFLPPDDTPALTAVARAVWDSREVRLVYRATDVVVQPLGLILKGSTWYLLGRERRGADRLFRPSRIDAVELLDHRFERPPGVDLAAAWTARRQAFLDSIPEYFVTVRVAPTAELLLTLLDEGRPDLPLPNDVERDEHGWDRLRLRFQRPEEPRGSYYDSVPTSRSSTHPPYAPAWPTPPSPSPPSTSTATPLVSPGTRSVAWGVKTTTGDRSASGRRQVSLRGGDGRCGCHHPLVADA
jgi:hypothetical protein